MFDSTSTVVIYPSRAETSPMSGSKHFTPALLELLIGVDVRRMHIPELIGLCVNWMAYVECVAKHVKRHVVHRRCVKQDSYLSGACV